MDHLGAEYCVILNDPELRRGLIREAARMRRAAHAAGTRRSLRIWLTLIVRRLTSRPEPRTTLDLRPAPVPEFERS